MFTFHSPAGAVVSDQPAKVANSRVTVVGEHSDGELNIAVARCSHKDNFCRKTGRMIASGRLNREKLFTKLPMENCDTKTFVDIAKSVAESVKENYNVYDNE